LSLIRGGQLRLLPKKVAGVAVAAYCHNGLKWLVGTELKQKLCRPWQFSMRSIQTQGEKGDQEERLEWSGGSAVKSSCRIFRRVPETSALLVGCETYR
jgi:hypothetical protein